MVEISIHSASEARFFQKTDSPYYNECGARNEYSEFPKTLVSSARSLKIVTDENRCICHRYDVGCRGGKVLYFAAIMLVKHGNLQ